MVMTMNKKQATLFQTWGAKKQLPKEIKSNEDDPIILDDDDDNEMLLQAMQMSLLDSATINSGNPVENLLGFDVAAGRTWVYPTNYPRREYQFKIVEQSLFSNTLVILPTGLGKTLIAAVVMYNFYRWYPQGKIIFMAPARPLVTQQIEACYKVMGIPQSDTVEMTGSMLPDSRKYAWMGKRVFFLTPQVMTNDLSRGICAATDVKCLVVDEAHKALGNHSYCQVVRELLKYTNQFRVLALTASPGSDLKAVRQVLMNLLISHVELRTDESPDIQPYTHSRKIEKIIIQPNEELKQLRSRFLAVITPYLRRLEKRGAISCRDPKNLSKFVVLKLKEAFCQNPPHAISKRDYGFIQLDFAVCISLYHAYELLCLHGSRSCYRYLSDHLNGEKGHGFGKAELVKNADFQDLFSELQSKYKDVKVQMNISASKLFQNSFVEDNVEDKPFVYGHPKLEKLEEIVIAHFKKFQNDAAGTRVMIFSQYRDSVCEITEMLQRHRPLVRAMSFIGQNSTTTSNRGFTQKMQVKVVRQFREGGFNTLVSTCVGEEGLDIGEVDLIVCFDAPKSATRLVQRMGRTGRRREGSIIVLVSKGKEEQSYNQSHYNKTTVHRALSGGKIFSQLYPNNPRMVPMGLVPSCQHMHMTVGAYVEKSRKDSGTCAKKGSTGSKDSKSEEIFTDEELAFWNKELKVDQIKVPELILHLPFLSLGSEESHNKKKVQNGKCHLDANNWIPWQAAKQKTFKAGHSKRSSVLVETLQLIEKQAGGQEDLSVSYSKAKNRGLQAWLKKENAMPPDKDFHDCTSNHGKKEDNGNKRDSTAVVSLASPPLENTEASAMLSTERIQQCIIRTPPNIDSFPYSCVTHFTPIKISEVLQKPEIRLGNSGLKREKTPSPKVTGNLSLSNIENTTKNFVVNDSSKEYDRVSSVSRKLNFMLDVDFSLDEFDISDNVFKNKQISSEHMTSEKPEHIANSDLDKQIKEGNLPPVSKVNNGGTDSSAFYVTCEDNDNEESDASVIEIFDDDYDLLQSTKHKSIVNIEREAGRLPSVKEWENDNLQLTSTPVTTSRQKETGYEDTSCDLFDDFEFEEEQFSTHKKQSLEKTSHSPKYSLTELLCMINKNSCSEVSNFSEAFTSPTQQNNMTTKRKVSHLLELELDSDSWDEFMVPPTPSEVKEKEMGKTHGTLVGKVFPHMLEKTGNSTSVFDYKNETATLPSSNALSLNTRCKTLFAMSEEKDCGTNVKDSSRISVGRSILDMIDDIDGEAVDFKDEIRSDMNVGSPTKSVVTEKSIVPVEESTNKSKYCPAASEVNAESHNHCTEQRNSFGKFSLLADISPLKKNIERLPRINKLALKKIVRLPADAESKLNSCSSLISGNLNTSDRKVEVKKEECTSIVSSDDEVQVSVRKKKMFFNISDGENPVKHVHNLSDDSDNFFPKTKKLKRMPGHHFRNIKRVKKNASGKRYIEEEAALTGTCFNSSDESEGSSLDNYDSSFVEDEEEASCIVDQTADIQAVYLRSVRSPAGVGKFKLKYDFDHDVNVCSQEVNSDEISSDYEEDSFCVRNESIEKKPVGKKCKPRSRIICHSSDDEEEEEKIERENLTNPSVCENRENEKYWLSNLPHNNNNNSNKILVSNCRDNPQSFVKAPVPDTNTDYTSNRLQFQNNNTRALTSDNCSAADLGNNEFGCKILLPLQEEENVKENSSNPKPITTQQQAEKNCWLNKASASSLSDRNGFTKIKEYNSSSRVDAILARHGIKFQRDHKESPASSSSVIVDSRKNFGIGSSAVVFVDTREIVNSQAVVSNLRATHHVTTVVRHLDGAGYVLSKKLAVERMCLSDFCNGQNRKKLLERVRNMFHFFDTPCLIIERDPVKKGEKPKVWFKTKYMDSTLCLLMKTHLKIFFTDDSVETADLLFHLLTHEEKIGNGISVCTNISPEKEQVLQFYLSLPCVSIVTAFYLLESLESVGKIVTCSMKELEVKGNLSSSRAKTVHEYLKTNFSSVPLAAQLARASI